MGGELGLGLMSGAETGPTTAPPGGRTAQRRPGEWPLSELIFIFSPRLVCFCCRDEHYGTSFSQSSTRDQCSGFCFTLRVVLFRERVRADSVRKEKIESKCLKI